MGILGYFSAGFTILTRYLTIARRNKQRGAICRAWLFFLCTNPSGRDVLEGGGGGGGGGQEAQGVFRRGAQSGYW